MDIARSLSDASRPYVPPGESALSRVCGFLAGVFFVIGCPLALFLHPYLLADITSSAFKTGGFAVCCLFCGAVGVAFIVMGLTGHWPSRRFRH